MQGQPFIRQIHEEIIGSADEGFPRESLLQLLIRIHAAVDSILAACNIRGFIGSQK